MNKWSPKKYDKDPMVNALLNIAESLAGVGEAVDGLLYGLKYGKSEGMSIAESIVVGAQKIAARGIDTSPIAEAIHAVANVVAESEGVKP